MEEELDSLFDVKKKKKSKKKKEGEESEPKEGEEGNVGKGKVETDPEALRHLRINVLTYSPTTDIHPPLKN